MPASCSDLNRPGRRARAAPGRSPSSSWRSRAASPRPRSCRRRLRPRGRARPRGRRAAITAGWCSMIDQRVAALDEAVEHPEQAGHVGEVEAGRGLVEHVERGLVARAGGELAGELEALGLAAGERVRALADAGGSRRRDRTSSASGARIFGWAAKTSAASSAVSCEDLADREAEVAHVERRRLEARRRRRPRRAWSTSGRKDISCAITPCPSQTGQRPPAAAC